MSKCRQETNAGLPTMHCILRIGMHKIASLRVVYRVFSSLCSLWLCQEICNLFKVWCLLEMEWKRILNRSSSSSSNTPTKHMCVKQGEYLKQRNTLVSIILNALRNCLIVDSIASDLFRKYHFYVLLSIHSNIMAK